MACATGPSPSPTRRRSVCVAGSTTSFPISRSPRTWPPGSCLRRPNAACSTRSVRSSFRSSRARQRSNGLVFNFKEDGPTASDKVFTGHNDGEIMINIAEADDPFREKLRKQMGEGYRTVLGHFRHEIGHYYWDRLVRDTALDRRLPRAVRRRAGELRGGAQASLPSGPPGDWPSHYISSYATMHPWEDWAETLGALSAHGGYARDGGRARPGAAAAGHRRRSGPRRSTFRRASLRRTSMH